MKTKSRSSAKNDGLKLALLITVVTVTEAKATDCQTQIGLDVSLFDTNAFKDDGSICSRKLQDSGPNYFRYLQPLSEYLYVGAMNCLLRLHQENVTHKDSRSFPVDPNDHWKCTIQGLTGTPNCQNHIRAVMPDVNDENKLFVCGTGGYAPIKYSIHDINLDEGEPKEDGKMYCPFDPLDNVTSIHIHSGNLGNKPAHYFGLNGDFIKHLPVLFRPSFNISVYPDLVSARGDVTWLNAPQFVGSFNVESAVKGNQVFYFFREIGEEYSASKTKIFSRVAKVCKNDHGADHRRWSHMGHQKQWLSYQKARLNCSLPGFDSYYWDEIYDVYESGDKFYALFFKSGDDHNSSAICVYTKSEIFRVFSGSFRYIVNKTWETLSADQHPNPRLDDCYIHDTNHSVFNGPQTVSRYHLMEQTVSSLYKRPIYSRTGVQFLKIVVLTDKDGNGSNIYVATDSGEVYSLFLYDCDGADFQLEENAILAPLDKPHPVWDMKLLENRTSIYLGTDYEVAKVNIDVCTLYKRKDSCIHNVLCFWCNDTNVNACRPRDNSSCHKKVTYNDVYKTYSGQCQVSDIFQDLDNRGHNNTGCGWPSTGNISATASSTTNPNIIASSLVSSKSSFQTKIVPSTVSPQAATKTIGSTTMKTGISTASMSISPTSSLRKTNSNVMHSMTILNSSKTSSGNQSTTLVALPSSTLTSASTTPSMDPSTTPITISKGTTPPQVKSTKTMVTIPPKPIKCAICAGPPEACELAYYEDYCQPPKHYCINNVTNKASGERLVERRCGNIQECYRDWYIGSSDDDKCRQLSSSTVLTYYFECSYCCIKDGCNIDLHPKQDTLYMNI